MFDMDGKPILLCTKSKEHHSSESSDSLPTISFASPSAKSLIKIGTIPSKTVSSNISPPTHLCTPIVETLLDDGLPFPNTSQDLTPPRQTLPPISIVSAAAFELIVKLGEDKIFLLDMQLTTSEPVSLHAMGNQPALTTLLHEKPLLKEEFEIFKVVIPEEYHDFFDIFSRANTKTLPPNCPYDHTIKIKNNGSPPHGSIYPLSNTKLEALHDYLEDMLGKGFIHPSQSPGGAPVVFMKKKDGSLRMCVDY